MKNNKNEVKEFDYNKLIFNISSLLGLASLNPDTMNKVIEISNYYSSKEVAIAGVLSLTIGIVTKEILNKK